ncbi:unnamed protein product [Pleuronectes platessa]|uniref:Uncharacterized protein n=1 Tax=Pleuronectes platessa TaxID=8262 RepID=A0A9N7YJL4_PLEPL|nr:unnamed protein product [Pleuronectes platessa]
MCPRCALHPLQSLRGRHGTASAIPHHGDNKLSGPRRTTGHRGQSLGLSATGANQRGERRGRDNASRRRVTDIELFGGGEREISGREGLGGGDDERGAKHARGWMTVISEKDPD